MSEQSPVNTIESQETVHASLLEALERFYSAASFYPSGHTKCRDALIGLFDPLQSVVPAHKTLILEPWQQGVRLQGRYLDDTFSGAAFFGELLQKLGLARMEFPRSPALEELHHVVCTLNFLKLESESSLEFHSLDFSAMPDSVKIVPREFGGGRFNLGEKHDLSEKLNALAERIERQPWSDARKEEFRHKAEAFLIKTIERMDTRNEAGQVQSALGQRNLEDVLALGTTAISQAIGLVSGESDTRNIEQLFGQAAESLAYANDSESVGLMMEVFHEATDLDEDNEESEAGVESDSTSYEMSVDDLTALMMQNAARSELPDLNDKENTPEILAVGLQMILSGASPEISRKVHGLIRRSLATSPDSSTMKELETMVSSLVSQGDRKPIDQVLPILMPTLVRHGGDRFVEYLQENFPSHQVEKVALVWPHLVNLILQPKPPQHKMATQVLVAAVINLPRENILSEAHRLDFLPVVRNGKLGPLVFSLPLEKSNGILSALLAGRQSKLVGQRLYQQWLEKPPTPLIAVTMKVLGGFKSKHRNLFQDLLLHPEPASQPRELKNQIARLLHQAVEKIQGPGRKETWVPQAIEQLGLLGCRESQTLLNRILGEKRLLILPAWPDACRQAATEALDNRSRTS